MENKITQAGLDSLGWFKNNVDDGVDYRYKDIAKTENGTPFSIYIHFKENTDEIIGCGLTSDDYFIGDQYVPESSIIMNFSNLKELEDIERIFNQEKHEKINNM